jgi:hypothetical protein
MKITVRPTKERCSLLYPGECTNCGCCFHADQADVEEAGFWFNFFTTKTHVVKCPSCGNKLGVKEAWVHDPDKSGTPEC